MRLNQSKLALEVGCSQQNIFKLIKKGVLVIEEDRKLDLESSLQRLRDFDLLDDNNKLKKTRTKKEVKPNITEKAKSYKKEEQIKKQEQEAFKKLEIKKQEAKSKNIDTSIDYDIDLKEFNYAKAKAYREHYLGQIAELDYKIKLGEYISKAEVESSFFEVARKVRDMLLNLPSKMALRVIGKKDIKEIERILDEEIRYILGNLSQ